MNEPGQNGIAKRIRIDVPEAYKKIDFEVWEELETYIFTGFLTSPARILGKSYVFKSLNHQEMRNIEFLKPSFGSSNEVRNTFRSALIAHSVFMVDGRNAIFERPRHIEKLTRIFSKIPAEVQNVIVENLSALNRRATRLHPLTEVYVHENRSRFRWLQLSGSSVHSPMFTGLPGTDELGMNYCQLTWTALNNLTDKREEIERNWNHAKFVGSCFNGKGVRSVDEKDRARLEKERQDVEDLKMKVLYRYLNRKAGPDEEPPATVALPDGRTAIVEKKFQAQSVEELAEQLSAALSGEKDHHDLMVERRHTENQKQSRLMDEYARELNAPPVANPEGYQTAAAGGARILGGKADADAYMKRMMALRDAHLEKMRLKMNQEITEPSDESPEGKG